MDLPERCREQGTTKRAETELHQHHGHQGGADQGAKSSCLLLVLFAACPVCCLSCLQKSKGFVPRPLRLWLNQKIPEMLLSGTFCGY